MLHVDVPPCHVFHRAGTASIVGVVGVKDERVEHTHASHQQHREHSTAVEGTLSYATKRPI